MLQRPPINALPAGEMPMALKLTLKPGERMIIGGAVIRNGDAKIEIFVENKIPLLREKDIMGEAQSDSVAKKIYFTIQLMYIDPENLVNHHNAYWNLMRSLVQAAPSTLALVDQISEQILAARYYQALKLAQKLIAYEQEMIRRV